MRARLASSALGFGLLIGGIAVVAKSSERPAFTVRDLHPSEAVLPRPDD